MWLRSWLHAVVVWWRVSRGDQLESGKDAQLVTVLRVNEVLQYVQGYVETVIVLVPSSRHVTPNSGAKNTCYLAIMVCDDGNGNIDVAVMGWRRLLEIILTRRVNLPNKMFHSSFFTKEFICCLGKSFGFKLCCKARILVIPTYLQRWWIYKEAMMGHTIKRFFADLFSLW